MNNSEIINNFNLYSKSSLSITDFLLNIAFAIILSSLISFIYIKYGTTLSNRRSFANNFPVICITTLIVITIVKSSLALSLGLVGALSIVRFRTAIKEPEELSFTFLSIAIGLGLGASQISITCLGVFVVCAFIVVKRKYISKSFPQSTNLLISSNTPKSINVDLLLSTLNEYANMVNLQRLNESELSIEMTIMLQFANYKRLLKLKDELKNKFPSISYSFVDNTGIS